jgi:hypothetical protein
MSHAFSAAFSTSFNEVHSPVGNWYSLVGMIHEAAGIDEKDRSTAPTSCPNDGTALLPGPEGKLFCPWDGLVWPDEASAWGEFPGSY